MLTRRDFSKSLTLTIASSALFAGTKGAFAADYPDKPVHIVIGFPAGSGADILCRYFQNALGKLSGATFVMDNKGGATGNIALGDVARAPKDGYTLLMTANSNMAGSRYLFKNLPFDTLKDFTPVSSFAEITFVMVVSPKSPINNVQDLVKHLKDKKDNIYGYTNQTALLSTALFLQMTGAPAKSVAYKTAPDAVKDVVDSTLDFMIMDGTFAAPQINQGVMKAIAVTTAQRHASMPNVPTMQESGLAGFDFAPWWACYAPTGTPKPVIDKLNGWMQKITAMPETAEFLKTQGATAQHDGPDQCNARLKAELPRWESLVKAAGIEPA